MIKYKNECVGCPPEMGCSDACPYKKVPVYYCDECGEEIVDNPGYAEYYTTDGAHHLCKDCYEKALDYLHKDE